MPLNPVRPIFAAITSGAWKTALGTAITAAVSFGLLDTHQASLLDNIVAALATLLTAATSAIAQLHILRLAEPQVTPIAAPNNDAGVPLVPNITASATSTQPERSTTSPAN